MRTVLCLCLLSAVCLTGCGSSKEEVKHEPYVNMPADMDVTTSTPVKTPPAKTAQ